MSKRNQGKRLERGSQKKFIQSIQRKDTSQGAPDLTAPSARDNQSFPQLVQEEQGRKDILNACLLLFGVGENYSAEFTSKLQQFSSVSTLTAQERIKILTQIRDECDKEVNSINQVVVPVTNLQSFIRGWNIRQHVGFMSNQMAAVWQSLFNSERLYLQQIERLGTFYKAPLCDMVKSGELGGRVSLSDIDDLLPSDDILQVSRTIFSRLQAVNQHFPVLFSVGILFEKLSHMIEKVKQLEALQLPKLNSFLAKSRDSSGVSLIDLLHLPIKQIAKYEESVGAFLASIGRLITLNIENQAAQHEQQTKFRSKSLKRKQSKSAYFNSAPILKKQMENDPLLEIETNRRKRSTGIPHAEIDFSESKESDPIPSKTLARGPPAAKKPPANDSLPPSDGFRKKAFQSAPDLSTLTDRLSESDKAPPTQPSKTAHRTTDPRRMLAGARERTRSELHDAASPNGPARVAASLGPRSVSTGAETENTSKRCTKSLMLTSSASSVTEEMVNAEIAAITKGLMMDYENTKENANKSGSEGSTSGGRSGSSIGDLVTKDHVGSGGRSSGDHISTHKSRSSGDRLGRSGDLSRSGDLTSPLVTSATNSPKKDAKNGTVGEPSIAVTEETKKRRSRFTRSQQTLSSDVESPPERRVAPPIDIVDSPPQATSPRRSSKTESSPRRASKDFRDYLSELSPRRLSKDHRDPLFEQSSSRRSSKDPINDPPSPQSGGPPGSPRKSVKLQAPETGEQPISPRTPRRSASGTGRFGQSSDPPEFSSSSPRVRGKSISRLHPDTHSDPASPRKGAGRHLAESPESTSPRRSRTFNDFDHPHHTPLSSSSPRRPVRLTDNDGSPRKVRDRGADDLSGGPRSPKGDRNRTPGGTSPKDRRTLEDEPATFFDLEMELTAALSDATTDQAPQPAEAMAPAPTPAATAPSPGAFPIPAALSRTRTITSELAAYNSKHVALQPDLFPSPPASPTKDKANQSQSGFGPLREDPLVSRARSETTIINRKNTATLGREKLFLSMGDGELSSHRSRFQATRGSMTIATPEKPEWTKVENARSRARTKLSILSRRETHTLWVNYVQESIPKQVYEDLHSLWTAHQELIQQKKQLSEILFANSGIQEKQEQIEDLDSYIDPEASKLLREGSVFLFKSERQYLVFSDHFMLTKQAKGKRKKVVKGCWAFKDLQCQLEESESFDVLVFSFKVSSDQKTRAFLSVPMTDAFLFELFKERIEANNQKVFGVELGVLTKRPNESPIPQIIRETTSFILENKNLAEEGLFRKGANEQQIENLKEIYDKGEHKIPPNTDMFVVCDVLKLYLRSLPTPLLTYDLYWPLVNTTPSMTSFESVKTLVHSLPKANRKLLQHLLQFLFEVAKWELKTKMGASNLALVFAVNILKPPPSDADQAVFQMNAATDIVCFMLQTHEQLFIIADETPSTETSEWVLQFRRFTTHMTPIMIQMEETHARMMKNQNREEGGRGGEGRSGLTGSRPSTAAPPHPHPQQPVTTVKMLPNPNTLEPQTAAQASSPRPPDLSEDQLTELKKTPSKNRRGTQESSEPISGLKLDFDDQRKQDAKFHLRDILTPRKKKPSQSQPFVN